MANKLIAGGLLGSAVVVAAVMTAGPPALAGPTAAAARPAASALTWTAAQVPNPAGAASNTFQPLGLSCSSATDCVGGGGYTRLSPRNRLAGLLTLTGTTWTAATAPLPADAVTSGQLATVESVACPSAATCFAGGGYRQAPGSNQGMLLTLSGGTWSAATAPLPACASGNPDVTVAGMSCVSAAWCTAVGQYGEASGGQLGLLLRWSHGAWTATAAPVPACFAGVGSLDAVSCPSKNRCFASGWEQDAGTFAQQPMLLTWSKHAWTVVRIPALPNADANPFAELTAVSCATAKRCVAAGFYVDSAGNEQGVLLSWSGKKWTIQEAPLPADANAQPNAQLNAASCPTVSRCVVGGTYETADGTSTGLILSRAGKTWTPIAAPAIAYNLHGVSCLSATSCEALSWGISQPTALVGAGAAGS